MCHRGVPRGTAENSDPVFSRPSRLLIRTQDYILGYFQTDLSKLDSATKLRVPTEEFGRAEWRTADPSTTLRSGRDDNFVWERQASFRR